MNMVRAGKHKYNLVSLGSVPRRAQIRPQDARASEQDGRGKDKDSQEKEEAAFSAGPGVRRVR